jgi:tetratricopeptide (TPR) repeat protein
VALFRYCLTSILFWWILFILVVVLSYPVAQRVRAWQARRRFVARQRDQLEDPRNAEARFELARLHAEGRGWRRAAEFAEAAVQAARENPLYDGRPPYHFLRLWGDALFRSGRPAEAADAYTQALGAKSDVGYGDVRFGLARAFQRMGRTAEALETYRRAIEDNGSNLEAYFRAAQAAAALGRADEVTKLHAEFSRVASSLPRYVRQSPLRWRMAFLLFPVTRKLV